MASLSRGTIQTWHRAKFSLKISLRHILMICRATVLFLAVLLVVSRATADHSAPALTGDQVAPVSPADRAFVEDLEHRSFVYFWEQADRSTGLVADRARVDGGRRQRSQPRYRQHRCHRFRAHCNLHRRGTRLGNQAKGG